MLVSQKAHKIAESSLIFVSRPVRCSCKSIVMCYRCSPNDPWECPVCDRSFDKDFQVDLNPRDEYDHEQGIYYGFTPDMHSGAWQIEDADELLIMVASEKRQ